MSPLLAQTSSKRFATRDSMETLPAVPFSFPLYVGSHERRVIRAKWDAALLTRPSRVNIKVVPGPFPCVTEFVRPLKGSQTHFVSVSGFPFKKRLAHEANLRSDHRRLGQHPVIQVYTNLRTRYVIPRPSMRLRRDFCRFTVWI